MDNVAAKLCAGRVVAWFLAAWFWILALAGASFAQPLTSGVTFNFSDLPQATNASPATLESITVGGIDYGDFIVPDGYVLGFDPALHSATQIRFENTGPTLQSYITAAGGNVAAGVDAFEADAIPRFRSRNLNTYINLNTGTYAGDPPPPQSLQQSLTYNSPISLNLGGFVVIAERGGNNDFLVTVNGASVKVRRNCNGNDYINSGARYDNGQAICLSVIPLSSFGSTGTFDEVRLTCAQFIPTTNINRDCGDGKVFIVLETSELDVTKTTGAQSPLRPDNTFDQTFTIEVGNQGTLNVIDLQVLDDVLANLGDAYDPATGLVSGPTVTLFESPTGPSSMTGITGNAAFDGDGTDGEDNLIIFSAGVFMEPGDRFTVEFTVELSVTPETSGDRIVNTVTVEGFHTAGVITGNSTSNATVTLPEALLPPVAENIARTGNAVGADVTLPIVATASIGRTIDLASLRLLDPTAAPVTSLTVAGEGVWTVNADGTITFSPEDGFEGNPGVVSYTVADDQGILSNTATVTVGYTPAPSVSLVKSASVGGTGGLGDVITYTFVVTNTGDVTLRDVTVVDELPNLSAMEPAVLSSLAPAASAIFTATYEIGQSDLDRGSVTNVALAEAEYTDADGAPAGVEDLSTTGTDPAGNTIPDDELGTDVPTVTALVQRPAISFVVSVASIADNNGNAVTDAGDMLVYAFSITNSGNVTLTEATVDPASLSLDLTGFSCEAVSLAPGETVTLTCVGTSYTVTEEDSAAGTINLLATANAVAIVAGERVIVSDLASVANGLSERGLLLRKTAARGTVAAGDVVGYEIEIENTSSVLPAQLDLVDVLPAGFRYQPGSGTVDGVAQEPLAAGRQLVWQAISLAPEQMVVLRYDLAVGSSVGSGSHTNRAVGVNPVTGAAITGEATATVRLLTEPVFQCATVIGRVFDDRNHDGYFNDEPVEDRVAITDQTYYGGKASALVASEVGEPRPEEGLAGVRLVTPNGIAVTTDDHGRFSLPCAALPRDIGSNFMLRLDDRTLPLGYRMTTENPRVVRLTPGMLTKMNFGAAQIPVARVDLSAGAFSQTGELSPELQAGLQSLVGQVAARPSVIRLSYQAAAGEADSLGHARLRAVEQQIRRL